MWMEPGMGYVLLGREYRELPETESCSKDPAGASAVLEMARPGDLLLVKTTGRGYALGRSITRNSYDHIAVVLPDNETLNIIFPRAVILPLSAFRKPQNAPLILRPQWESTEQRDTFIREMQGFVDARYDLTKTFTGIFLTCLCTWLGIRVAMRKRREPPSKWICTEAILASLFKASREFEAIKGMKLDYTILGFATTNDFLRISARFPNLLAIQKVS